MISHERLERINQERIKAREPVPNIIGTYVPNGEAEAYAEWAAEYADELLKALLPVHDPRYEKCDVCFGYHPEQSCIGILNHWNSDTEKARRFESGTLTHEDWGFGK